MSVWQDFINAGDKSYQAKLAAQRQLDNRLSELAYKQQIEEDQARRLAEQVDNIYGTQYQPVNLGKEVENIPTKYGNMDFNVGGVNVPRKEGFVPEQQATGAFINATPEEERTLLLQKNFLKTGVPIGTKLVTNLVPRFQTSVLQNENTLQQNVNNNRTNLTKARIAAQNKIAQIKQQQQFNLEHPELNSKETAHLADYKNAKDIYERKYGRPLTPDEEAELWNITINRFDTQTLAERAKARQAGKNEADYNKQLQENADLATQATAGADYALKLLENVNDAQVGYFTDQLPTFTESAQLLDQSFKNLIPSVRKTLGPGVLSDSDLKLLQNALPNMSMDKETIRKSLLHFKEVQQQIINKYTKQKPINSNMQKPDYSQWKIRAVK